MDRATRGWTLVVNDLCRQAVSNQRIVLRSSGRQCRDFIPLHDVARAIDHFVAIPAGRWGREVYNLGGECTMSILEVAKRVAAVYERLHAGAQLVVSAGANSASLEEHRPFRYSTDKIRSAGFRLEGDMNPEIEQTLRMCIEKAVGGAG
jgi:UDP-glucose 4-epimerase